MKKIIEQSFKQNGITIKPGETVLFVSTSWGSTGAKMGTYLGVDPKNLPVVKYKSKRFYWKDRETHGWKDCEVITSLPKKRIYSIDLFKQKPE